MKAVFRKTLLLITFLFIVSAYVQAEEAQLVEQAQEQTQQDEHEHERASCRVCGMWIDQYQRTAAVLNYKDNRKEEFSCGVACMLRIIEDEGGVAAFKSIQVHDWVSGELIDALTANYVLSSKIIPDMIPNYIAFRNLEEAESFKEKAGGVILGFDGAIADVALVGTTAPFRIRTAVTPGRGQRNIGIVYGYAQKDHVLIGTDSRDPDNFIESNGAQPKAPYKGTTHRQTIIANYSPTDRIALFIGVPFFVKENEQLTQSQPGSFGKVSQEKYGLGDITLEGRYNFWRSLRYDKFAGALIRMTAPTGDFDGTREFNAAAKRELISTPAGLQRGKGTASFTGGLMYSHRYRKFWGHLSALYTVNPENSKDFKYGDILTGGLALHYTPHYDWMLGIETDANYVQRNEDRGYKIGNSGGTVTNVSFVADWRMINAFGGNFKLRSSIGLPVYEDLNSTVARTARGEFIQSQLGGGFFANIAIQWTQRKASFDYIY